MEYTLIAGYPFIHCTDWSEAKEREYFLNESMFELQVGDRVKQVGESERTSSCRADFYKSFVEYVGTTVQVINEPAKALAFKIPNSEVVGIKDNERLYKLYFLCGSEIVAPRYDTRNSKNGIRIFRPVFIKLPTGVKGYRGNKSPTSLYPKIINEFPAHKVYWELFAGSAQILRKKKPAKLNIVCEKDLLTDYPSGTVVLHDCAISLLDELQFLGKDHLIYLDPPYIIKERLVQRNYYKFELTDLDHAELIRKLLLCRCCIAISHYPCKEYDVLLQHGWRRIDMKVSYRGTVVTESLYMNYPASGQLHETTFVGINKTDRQRIKRKASNLRRSLLEMPENERQAVLEAIADLR